MFDTIRVDRWKLPGRQKPRATAWLQTKDLECVCTTYEIRDDGELWEVGGARVMQNEPLNFYTFENGWWFEYNAIFADGICTRIDLVVAENDKLNIKEIPVPDEKTKPWLSSNSSFSNGVCSVSLSMRDGRAASGTATYEGDEPQGEARHAVKKAARNAALASIDVEYND